MTLVVGVDPSAKKIALVAKETILNVQRAEAHILYKGSQKQTPDSIHAAMEAMWAFLGGLDSLRGSERLAWVESPLVGRGGINTTIKQAYVGGVIRACLVEVGFTVYDVHVSTWRAGLGIKGRGTEALKVATSQYVATMDPKMHQAVGGDSDLTDAGAICLYGIEQTRKAAVVRSTGLAGSSVQGRGRKSLVR